MITNEMIKLESCWCHVDRRRNPVSGRTLSTSSFSWSNGF